LDSKASLIRDAASELAVRLLERAQAPITPYRGYVCVRPAGRTYLEVKVLYSPGKGKS
jgi:hypothetical protein